MEKHLIRLLIFTKNIDGGTGTFVLQLFRLEKIIQNLDVQTFCLEVPSYRRISKQKKDDLVFFRSKKFYPHQYKFSFKNIKAFIEDILWFKKNTEKVNPDIILGIDIYCNLIISLLKIFFYKKTKIVLTTHINIYRNIEQRSDAALNFLLSKFINFFYNRADLLVFVSKRLTENCIKRFQLKKRIVLTIYNGILIKKNIYFEHKDQKKNIIITVSRLVEQKDHLTLFKAFSLLQKRLSDSYLWIVSDGIERRNIRNTVKKSEVKDSIKFFGWVKNIQTYLNKSSIFVLSSKREGFGYVLIEAMSQGLPVIATDTPYGPREILDNGKYGILVPMKDSQAMAEAMYKLLTDRKLYSHYSKMSIERAKFFSEKKMLNAYKKIITKLVNEN